MGIVRWTRHGDGNRKAYWQPTLPAAGRYQVLVYYGDDPIKDHATDASFTVKHAGGETTATVSFRENCRKWNSLGEFEFEKGEGGSVMLSNAASGHVVADAVKFIPVP
jgi:hypothetical protein